MADGFVGLPPDLSGKKVDASELTVNSQTVERQRIVTADPADPLALGAVKNAAPSGSEYGLVVRPIPAVSAGVYSDVAVTDASLVTVGSTMLALTKGLVKILADAWDAVNHRLNVNVVATTGVKPGDLNLDGAKNLGTKEQPSTTITDGQKTAITAAVQIIAASTPCSEVLVQADPGNAANLLVGGTAPKLVLTPGQSVTIPVDNANKVWAQAVSGTLVANFLARA